MLFPFKLKHLDNPVPLPPVFTITQDLEAQQGQEKEIEDVYKGNQTTGTIPMWWRWWASLLISSLIGC